VCAVAGLSKGVEVVFGQRDQGTHVSFSNRVRNPEARTEPAGMGQ